MLAEHFLKHVCLEHGVPKKELEAGAAEALQGVNWTGNIRELRNIIERLVILCGDKISAADVELYANPKR